VPAGGSRLGRLLLDTSDERRGELTRALQHRVGNREVCRMIDTLLARAATPAQGAPTREELKAAFPADIKAVVTGYLFNNRAVVMAEMERYGVASPQAASSRSQVEAVQSLQRSAAAVAKLQLAQELARRIVVGFEYRAVGPEMGFAPVQTASGVYFHPEQGPPAIRSHKDLAWWTPVPDGMTAKPYEDVKARYDLVSEQIAIFQRRQPAVYAVARSGKSATTAAFAAIDDPAQAHGSLGAALKKLFHDIEGAQAKLDSGDLNALDLVPVANQLMAGTISTHSGIRWSDPEPRAVGEELLKGHSLNAVLTALGLDALATLMFLLGPLTGGASAVAGLAVMAAKASRSTEQHATLSQAGQTAVIPGTELVTQGQVEDAELAMKADQLALGLAVLAVGATAAGKALAAVRAPAPAGAGAAVGETATTAPAKPGPQPAEPPGPATPKPPSAAASAREAAAAGKPVSTEPAGTAAKPVPGPKPGGAVDAATPDPAAKPAGPAAKPAQPGLGNAATPPALSARDKAAATRFLNRMRTMIRNYKDPTDPTRKHPLSFLLEPAEKGKLDWRKTTRETKSGNTQTGRYEGNEKGPVVQIGHQGAKAAGVAEQFMLEDADLNQIGGNTIETPGAFSFKPAVQIAGVPVDIASALQWERLGLLTEGTVAASPVVPAPTLPAAPPL
jgi:hypothetical protein